MMDNEADNPIYHPGQVDPPVMFVERVHLETAIQEKDVRAVTDEIHNSLIALAKKVGETRNTEELDAFLKLQAKFHRYSPHNTMLILMQRENASRVMGYRAWLELGRQVKAGEHSIRIFCPRFKNKKYEHKEVGPEGDEVTITETKQVITAFILCPVFDVSQTSGKPLPDVDIHLRDETALLPFMETIVTAHQIKFNYVTADELGGAEGDSAGGVIRIKIELSTGDKFRVMVHEFAHELLHQTIRKAGGELPERDIRETEAECVSHVVCHHFNMPTAAHKYLAIWQPKSEEVINSFRRIKDVAAKIITDIENKVATTPG